MRRVASGVEAHHSNGHGSVVFREAKRGDRCIGPESGQRCSSSSAGSQPGTVYFSRRAKIASATPSAATSRSSPSDSTVSTSRRRGALHGAAISASSGRILDVLGPAERDIFWSVRGRVVDGADGRSITRRSSALPGLASMRMPAWGRRVTCKYAYACLGQRVHLSYTHFKYTLCIRGFVDCVVFWTASVGVVAVWHRSVHIY